MTAAARVSIAAAIAVLCACACKAQTQSVREAREASELLPDAPTVQVAVIADKSFAPSPALSPLSPFWTHERRAVFAINIGSRAADIAQTCQRIGDSPQFRERWIPGAGRSCGAVTAWIASGEAVEIMTEWYLHKHGHDRMAKALGWMSAAGSGVSVGYTKSH